MSTTVTNIAERRRPDRIGRPWTPQDAAGARAISSLDARQKANAAHPIPLSAEALEASLDAYRATMLELAHRRQAFEMQMTLELNTAQIKLEAAAYKAMLSGVPESDIYALGEDMADALSSAMNTVAGA
jgi:hypothetical protein